MILSLLLFLLLPTTVHAFGPYTFTNSNHSLGLDVRTVENPLKRRLENLYEGPKAFAMLPEAMIFADSARGRMLVLSEDGSVLREIPYPGILQEREVTPTLIEGVLGNLFVYDRTGQRLLVHEKGEWNTLLEAPHSDWVQMIRRPQGLRVVDALQKSILDIQFQGTSAQISPVVTGLKVLPFCSTEGICASILPSKGVTAVMPGSFDIGILQPSGEWQRALTVGPISNFMGVQIFHLGAGGIVLGIHRGTGENSRLSELRMYQASGELKRVRKFEHQVVPWDLQPAARVHSRRLFLPWFRDENPPSLGFFIFPLG